MHWILIIVTATVAGNRYDYANPYMYRSDAVAHIEFNTLNACQTAGEEIKKRARTVKMVCVQKGGA